jgi:carbonic anhydrase
MTASSGSGVEMFFWASSRSFFFSSSVFALRWRTFAAATAWAHGCMISSSFGVRCPTASPRAARAPIASASASSAGSFLHRPRRPLGERRSHARVRGPRLTAPCLRRRTPVMQNLARGIHAFQANYFATHRALFEQLATNGQRPETMFITCSDSRVVPNLITGAAPGELFIVRNVGNIVPSVSRGVLGGVAAAIEYAVRVLEVENLIVCGHTGCGAIDAIVHPERAAHLPFVSQWLRESASIPRILAERYAHLEGEARLLAALEENVLVQLENLRTYDFVTERLDRGALKMNGWVFRIATGEVFDYDPLSEQFIRLAAAGS